MAEFDTIIKGGTIVDGTRAPRYTSDMAIKEGRITQIGGLRGAQADKVLDASGLIVAPGFVDLHTHYDAQLFWDPYCSLSGWHGVTSVAIGNCGFGFAPCRVTGRPTSILYHMLLLAVNKKYFSALLVCTFLYAGYFSELTQLTVLRIHDYFRILHLYD